jgi:hypothetical protein
MTQRILVRESFLAMIAVSVATGAGAGVVRCDLPAGKVVYQDKPCPDGSKTTVVRIVPPAPGARTDARSAPTMQAKFGGASPPAAMTDPAAYRIETIIVSPAGPLNAWSDMLGALARGDKAAAMEHLTPSAQQRYGPVFDTLIGPNRPR